MNRNNNVHLLLRFSDMLLKEGDTILEHNKIVESNGFVWFGKMGTPVASKSIAILNQQVEKGIPTYVYLIKGNRKKPLAFLAELIIAARELPKREIIFTPSYYKDLELIKYMHFWVKMKQIIPIEFSRLERMRAISSVYPLPETLIKSSCGHFLIRESNLLF